MAKKAGQKIRILFVLDILKRLSDEAHPITAEDICAELEKLGLEAERKAIYADISALGEYGFDIIKSGYPRGFFLGAREFEEPEIYILADAVRTAKFISPVKTRELVGKLDSFLSVSRRAQREARVYFSADTKCENEEIFYSIDKISGAVASGKKIEFDYVSRRLSDDRTAEKAVKHMKISPYALVWRDDHYYVLGNYEKYDNIIHLRLDRIHSVEITKEKSRHFSEVSAYKDTFDVADYTEKLFSMHGGRVEEIELFCSADMTEQVFDRFGESIFIKNVSKNGFGFSVKAAVSEALVTWVMNYGSKIRVISPQELVQMVTDRAKAVLDMYGE